MKKKNQKKLFQSGVILPILVSLITILLTYILGNNLVDSIIISLLMGAITSLITMSYNMDQLRGLYHELNENLNDIESFLSIKKKTEQIEHPYFSKWSQGRLRAILERNKEFFSGTNWTNPHAVDTFGIEGLSYTKKNGSIKAVSVVPDYWEDDFSKEYLEQQRLLIRNKKVTIDRIFIFTKEKKEKMNDQMKLQKDYGINVRFVYSDNEYLPPNWLKEDFLIQDDTLLVQIFCDSHRFMESGSSETEMITIKANLVAEKVEQFKRMWERANKFEENEKNC